MTLRPDRPSLWHHPDFMKLWTGQTISEVGSRITREGLPLAAVLTLGATPTQMGWLAAVGSLPVLLIGLFAGAWVDRLHRRPILVLADLGRALLLLTIPLAAILGTLNIVQLYIVIALAGILSVFFDVAYGAYLPSLVGRDYIVEGNQKLALSGSTAEVLGPSLAGFLVQLITAPMAILLDALSFLISALSVGSIRKEEHLSLSPHARQHIGREIKEGLGVALGHPVLRALVGMEGTSAFFGNFFGTLYGLYAIRELGLGAAALGATITFGGLGDLAGAFLASRLPRRWRLGNILIGSLVFKSGASMLIPLAGGSPWTAMIMLMIAQLFGDGARTIYDIHAVSLRQTITPDHVLGRVNASLQFAIAGLGPMGALLGGILAETIGIRLTLTIAVLGGLFASAWLVLSPVRKMVELPPPITPPAFDSTPDNG